MRTSLMKKSLRSTICTRSSEHMIVIYSEYYLAVHDIHFQT
jgi:hypothetical protein